MLHVLFYLAATISGPYDDGLSAHYQQCLDKSGGVTSNLRDCNATEFKRLDALLNIEYRRAMSRLPRAERSKLRQRQRDWLRTRWQECDREAAAEEGGTLALIISDGCSLGVMEARVRWLSKYRD